MEKEGVLLRFKLEQLHTTVESLQYQLAQTTRHLEQNNKKHSERISTFEEDKNKLISTDIILLPPLIQFRRICKREGKIC
jgi:hypothetical protein